MKKKSHYHQEATNTVHTNTAQRNRRNNRQFNEKDKSNRRMLRFLFTGLSLRHSDVQWSFISISPSVHLYDGSQVPTNNGKQGHKLSHIRSMQYASDSDTTICTTPSQWELAPNLSFAPSADLRTKRKRYCSKTTYSWDKFPAYCLPFTAIHYSY